jgi:hypothetical protein
MVQQVQVVQEVLELPHRRDLLELLEGQEVLRVFYILEVLPVTTP